MNISFNALVLSVRTTFNFDAIVSKIILHQKIMTIALASLVSLVVLYQVKKRFWDIKAAPVSVNTEANPQPPANGSIQGQLSDKTPELATDPAGEAAQSDLTDHEPNTDQMQRPPAAPHTAAKANSVKARITLWPPASSGRREISKDFETPPQPRATPAPTKTPVIAITNQQTQTLNKSNTAPLVETPRVRQTQAKTRASLQTVTGANETPPQAKTPAKRLPSEKQVRFTAAPEALKPAGTAKNQANSVYDQATKDHNVKVNGQSTTRDKEEKKFDVKVIVPPAERDKENLNGSQARPLQRSSSINQSKGVPQLDLTGIQQLENSVALHRALSFRRPAINGKDNAVVDHESNDDDWK